MDELFLKLNDKISPQEANKCLKYSVGYVRRQRNKRILYASNNGTELDLSKFKSEASIRAEGPYGKTWQAGVKDRPTEALLKHALACGPIVENIFQR